MSALSRVTRTSRISAKARAKAAPYVHVMRGAQRPWSSAEAESGLAVVPINGRSVLRIERSSYLSNGAPVDPDPNELYGPAGAGRACVRESGSPEASSGLIDHAEPEYAGGPDEDRSISVELEYPDTDEKDAGAPDEERSISGESYELEYPDTEQEDAGALDEDRSISEDAYEQGHPDPDDVEYYAPDSYETLICGLYTSADSLDD
ncbi:hypothetical protein BD626DRAFT_539186 [Schizophyllum amplum]|uniref:Uncharacterized protein n=1 Tax=Schizophyllum amplum TaxID=97359 RepID=A0A550C4L0_9AGAR|nr:hypothetical protein BD626DRAFT_539186 [Auriculariopsis ampla]